MTGSEICRTKSFLECTVLSDVGGTQMEQGMGQPTWDGVGSLRCLASPLTVAVAGIVRCSDAAVRPAVVSERCSTRSPHSHR